MRICCLLLLMLGCAEMPVSDNPLAPAVREAPTDQPVINEQPVTPEPPPPKRGAEQAEAVISEVVEKAKALAKGEDSVLLPLKAEAKVEAKTEAKTGRASVQATVRYVGGPIQLISTILDATPPRAILGLPSGKEIVVKPGGMVLEYGFTVVSISEEGVGISRIVAPGNPVTLRYETLQLQR